VRGVAKRRSEVASGRVIGCVGMVYNTFDLLSLHPALFRSVENRE